MHARSSSSNGTKAHLSSDAWRAMTENNTLRELAWPSSHALPFEVYFW